VLKKKQEKKDIEDVMEQEKKEQEMKDIKDVKTCGDDMMGVAEAAVLTVLASQHLNATARYHNTSRRTSGLPR
jgi:hypothetical protein